MTDQSIAPVSRRRYLQAIGSAIASSAIAGCSTVELQSGPTPTERQSRSRTTSTEQPDVSQTTTTITPDTSTGTPGAERTDVTTPIHSYYETTEVAIHSEDGDVLGTVTAAIADTIELRYLGLSDTESLPTDRGMLFIFDQHNFRTFVMREMDFAIDIIYANAEREITTIHHAPAPGPNEDGGTQRYPGNGKYVLEVNYNWTTLRGVSVGDRLVFDL